VSAADEALVSAQQELRACEAAMREAETAAAAIGARLHALEGVERTYEGFAPAISAIMADRDLHRGVHGPLADFVHSEHPDAPAAEAALGSMLHALVVDDLDAARRVRRWFRDEWRGGGRLVLLPLDAPTLRGHIGGGAPDFAHGPGAPWVSALLAGLDADPGGDALDGWSAGRTRVGEQGDSVDPRGVVTLTARESGEGLLGRRAALAVMRSEYRTAGRERARRSVAAESAAEVLRRAEAAAAQAAVARREADSGLARARDAHALLVQRRARLDQERTELASELSRQQSAAAEHASRAAELGAQVDSVRAALTAVEAEAARERERVAALEAGLEQSREADAERRVGLARAEAALQEAERRLADAVAGAESAAGRLTAIGGEAEALREMLHSLSGHGERADEESLALTGAREEAVAEIARLDAELADVARDAEAAEGAVRASIADAESLAERRHTAALRAADAASRAARVRERLEAEWGRDWDAIATDAEHPGGGDPDHWRRELAEVVHDVDAIGPVNMLAVEEHEEERRRLEFLLEQQRDLVASRDDLLSAIRQINRTAREVFVATFESIREHFQRTFHALFEGGECDVRLADPADPLESAIEIQASPRGKKTQRIHLLSGGERTLTALALLFAIYLVKPSPFCLLDEVDAPLDESNVGRFIHLLQEWKAETQFIVITHNTRTMEAADWVYGVTMEEPGVSSIVGVELEGDPVEAGRVA
jgi:chromosome segregation protein